MGSPRMATLTLPANAVMPAMAPAELADEVGYVPRLWNVMDDAQQAGATTTFLSLTNVKAMDEEPGYNEQVMKTIAQRYEQAATRINQERASTLTDNTVIMVLSESFSDPNRVPGVHFNTDPMPFIRSLGDVTTAGLMLSPGYGGGTANIEFQQMTGLSMANFSDTMLIGLSMASRSLRNCSVASSVRCTPLAYSECTPISLPGTPCESFAAWNSFSPPYRSG